FCFDVTATTAIYTLSLHDALPIWATCGGSHNLVLLADGSRAGWGYNFYGQAVWPGGVSNVVMVAAGGTHSLALSRTSFVLPAAPDRKSTRLNSSHDQISYAVFCLK